MANLTETQKEIMNELYRTYKLTPEDIFTHRNYRIITRQGIDKLIAGAGIKFKFSDLYRSERPYVNKKGENKVGVWTSLKVTGGVDGEEVFETYGESSPGNTTNEYPIAMAEKRAKSRLTLMALGLYKDGFFGEDEADDFKRKQPTQTTQIKK